MNLPSPISTPEPATIAVAATFTAEPLGPTLRFWMQELQIPALVSFAPYGQMFQQLVDPSSLLGRNRHGVNVLCVRLTDLGGDAGAVEQNAGVFLAAVKAACESAPTTFLACLCPSQTGSGPCAGDYRQMEERIAAELSDIPSLHLVTSAQVLAAYPVAEVFDPHADRQAHVPFTSSYFTALGTMIARKIHVLRSARYKVVAVDADGSLWGGVCGEDGPQGVTIDPSRQAIQEFLVRQHEAGMLLCLCSRNHDEDVAAVFATRPEMVLQRRQIVGWQVNWRPKSENLRSLAAELGLGLESFIFLDDDPLACAEVQANCSEVLTLLLPQAPPDIAPFLQKIWAFDQCRLTDEGASRTELYRQNRERRQLQRESLTLREFLAGLGLKVHIAPLGVQHLARVAELTQRTNQLNTSGVRRSESDFRLLGRAPGPEYHVVHVKDRFGDYGLVGVMIFTTDSGALVVDTLLLSCRALGRGIEHRMLARLGEIALERGLENLEIRFVRTPRNQPALSFLEVVDGIRRELLNDGVLFRLAAEGAAAVRYDPPAGVPSPDPVAGRTTGTTAGDSRAQAALFSSIARELSDVGKIQDTVTAQRAARREMQTAFVPPTTDLEKTLTELFGELLAVDQVGINDNFFSLGGHSLLATMLISRLRDIFKVEIPISILFEIEFNVANLARVVGEHQAAGTAFENASSEMSQLLGALSDDDVRWLQAEMQDRSREQGPDANA